jgi:hypothetical protein
MGAMFFALLSPPLLAAAVAMSPVPGARLDDGLGGHHLRREAALPPATPVVVPTTAGSTRSVRTRTERFGPVLASKVRLHAPAISGAMVLPPPVMIRHPKATPSSSRDPTSPAH